MTKNDLRDRDVVGIDSDVEGDDCTSIHSV